MRLPSIAFPVLDEAEMEAIFQAGQRVLASVALRAEGDDEFYDAVRAVGCTVEGHEVRFPQPVIEDTLRHIARYKAEREPQPPPPEIRPAPTDRCMRVAAAEDASHHVAIEPRLLLLLRRNGA